MLHRLKFWIVKRAEIHFYWFEIFKLKIYDKSVGDFYVGIYSISAFLIPIPPPYSIKRLGTKYVSRAIVMSLFGTFYALATCNYGGLAEDICGPNIAL